MSMLLLTLLLTTCWGLASATYNLGPPPPNLVRAIVIFRHGIRNSFWNPLMLNTRVGDRGALTDQGKNKMKEAGRSFRGRYPDAAASDRLVTSTQSDRTMVSAQCFVGGLLGVQPESIVVSQDTPYDKHWLFEKNDTPPRMCACYKLLRSCIEDNEPPHSQYYAAVTKSVNNPDFTVNSLLTNFKLWDSINTEILLGRGRGLPDWTTRQMPQMEMLAKLQMWRLLHSKEGMLSFFTGPILSQVCQELQRGHKYHFHGSHDTTLNAVLWALGGDRWETYSVKQGDSVIIEQYADDRIVVTLFSPLSEGHWQVGSFDSLRGFQEYLNNAGLLLTEAQWRQKCTDTVTRYNVERSEPNY